MTDTTPRQRVEQEGAELRDRIQKLTDFLRVAKEKHNPVLLQLQLRMMESYLYILDCRLRDWRD